MSNILKSPESSSGSKIVQLSVVVDPELDALDSKMDTKSIEQTLEEKVEQAKRRAADILQQAELKRNEIEKQMKQKEEEAERKRAEAYENSKKAGFESGFKKGADLGRQSYLSRIDQANQLLEQANTEYRDKIAHSEPEILKLSMAVAEKIIGTSIALDEDKWSSMVTKAVREVRDQKTIKIIVPPIHFGTLDLHKEELDDLVQDADVSIYAGGDLTENDCIIETEFGRIDAGIDSQLSVIKEKLKELMEEHA